MQFREDWQRIVRYAWSVRLIALACVLSGCEVALPLIQPVLDVPPGVFAAAAGLTTAAAFVARLVAQKRFYASV